MLAVFLDALVVLWKPMCPSLRRMPDASGVLFDIVVEVGIDERLAVVDDMICLPLAVIVILFHSPMGMFLIVFGGTRCKWAPVRPFLQSARPAFVVDEPDHA